MKTGKVVKVINQDTQGNDFVEGFATVKGFDPDTIDGRYYCSVLIDGDSEPVYRWVSDNTLVSIMRGDRRVSPVKVEYRLLSFDECKALTGHSHILDQLGNIARVLITSVKTWKTRPDEIEVRYKFGLYEYGSISIVKDIADNDLLIALVKDE